VEILKTRGIILHQVKYSETSLIVKIYTEQCGLQTYIVKGVRKKNAAFKAGLFQPLNIVDLVAHHNSKKEIQYIKDISCVYNYKSLPFDIKKTTIAIFINELLYKSIHEEIPNDDLFNYIQDALIGLDEAEASFTDFHFIFAMQLALHLGFFPHGRYSSGNQVFDMMEGIFKPAIPVHTYYIDGQLCRYFDLMIDPDNIKVYYFNIPFSFRKLLLEKIIDYYRLHIHVFGNIRSHHVLEEVLRG